MAWYRLDPTQENGISGYTIGKTSPGPGWLQGPTTQNAKHMIYDGGIIRRRTPAEWDAYQAMRAEQAAKKTAAWDRILALTNPPTASFPNGIDDLKSHADAVTYVDEVVAANLNKELLVTLVEFLGNTRVWISRRIQ